MDEYKPGLIPMNTLAPGCFGIIQIEPDSFWANSIAYNGMVVKMGYGGEQCLCLNMNTYFSGEHCTVPVRPLENEGVLLVPLAPKTYKAFLLPPS